MDWDIGRALVAQLHERIRSAPRRRATGPKRAVCRVARPAEGKARVGEVRIGADDDSACDGQKASVPDGTNVLAVQAFNRSLDSSDFGFMAGLGTATDNAPPTVLALNPPADATVRSLTQIEVRFSEPVTNVAAADLLIKGTPVTAVDLAGPDRYLFTFATPTPGVPSLAKATNSLSTMRVPNRLPTVRLSFHETPIAHAIGRKIQPRTMSILAGNHETYL